MEDSTEFELYLTSALDFLGALRRSGVHLILESGVEILASADEDIASEWADQYTKEV